MNETVKKKISFFYSLVLSALLLTLAILFVVAAIRIYSLGESAFTPENISSEYSKISVLVIVTLVVTIGGGVLSLLIGTDKTRKGKRDSLLTLKTLSDRVTLSPIGTEAERGVLRERKFRETFKWISFILYATGTVVSLFYVLNPDNYAGVQSGSFNPNLDVAKSALAILICLFIPFVFSIVLLFLFERSRKKEITLLKAVIAEEKGKSSTTIEKGISKGNKDSILLGTRIARLGAAIIFIVIGIFNGGYGDILGKAVKICQECIGIG